MTQQEFQRLLDRYFNGTTSETEEQLIENFYAKLQVTEDGWNALGEEKKAELQSKIYEAIQQKKNTSIHGHRFAINKLIYRVAASVAILLAIGIGAINYFDQPDPDVKYITKYTQSGQKATIKLSDGSTIRLNSQSSITYPEPFAADQRAFTLQGEAFFDVKRDVHRPFIVTAHNIRTTVLGTTFDIRAYDPSSIAVALVSGKVKVKAHSKGGSDVDSEVFLNPGESAAYDARSGDIHITSFDQKKLTAWKDGIIYLSDAGYEQVFDKLAHWYGVEFQFVNMPAEQWNYSGEFQDMSLEVVLNTIGFSEGFEFQILGDVVKIEFEN